MLVSGCGLVLAAVIVITWPYEPMYRGQALGSYLTKSDLHEHEITAAFRDCATDSWPVALRFLKADKSSWSWRLRVLMTKQPFAKIELPLEPWYVARIGEIGFEALGTNATPAISELAEMLKQPRYAKRAAFALVCTGPASLVVITNRLSEGTSTEQAGVLYALSGVVALPGYVEHSDHSFWLRPVIPYVLRLANDPATDISSGALKVMEQWPTNEMRLVDLGFLMRSPNWGVRHSVVQWLRQRHPSSPEARALLTQATNDPYWLVQRSAEDALRTLPSSFNLQP